MSERGEYDIIVIGGGLVGAAAALALAGDGLRLALVEGVPPPPVVDAEDDWDSRIYAVSPGNVQFLRSLGAWDARVAARAADIHAMQVTGDDAASRLDFSALEAGVATLGSIVESRQMLAGMWACLQQRSDITLFCPARCAALQLQDDRATLTLQDGRALHAALVVGADGGNSWVRAQAGLRVTSSDYRQSGVVANFACALPHRNVARQWFRADGILAWLPLPGNRISMVWSTHPEHARALLALEPEALCARVAAAGGDTLGGLRLLTPAAAFPLRLQNAESMVRPRLALVGDAAHLVHPLAGQGVNLGFRDVVELARVMRARSPQQDLGDYPLLRRYARARKLDIRSMQATTDGLHTLFSSPVPGVDKLRNWGLAMTNRMGWLKKRLMAHAIT